MDALDLLHRLGRASLEGAVYAGALHLACRALPRLPPGVKSTLYWLACARLLVGLLSPGPLRLPILPAPSVASAPLVALSVPALAETSAPGLGLAAPEAPLWPWLLLGVFAIGVLAHLAQAALQLARAAAILRRAAPLADGPAPELLERLCRQLGVRRPPRLLMSAEVQGPQLSGFFHPAIVLPSPRAVSLTPAELRLSILHELHHLRRHDLWLGLVPAAARALFFFHPLARLCAREHALAREAACDAAVLGAGASPLEYGELLVRMGVLPMAELAGAASAAATVEGLKRRIAMLHASQKARPALTWLLLGLSGLLLLPMRLVAQPSAAPAVSKDHGDRDTDEDERDRAEEARDRAEETRERAVDQREREADAREREEEAKQEAPLQGSHRLARHHRDDEGASSGEAWVLVQDKDSVSMSGTMRDVHAAKGLGLPTPYLWFRKAGRAYVVTDAATVARARSLFAPQEELGKKQSALGEKQAALGEKQAALGERQGALGMLQAKLASRQARRALRQSTARAGEDDEGDDTDRIDQRMEELSRMQSALGEEQRKLGEQQRPLGEEQGRLGEEQGRLGQTAQAGIKALLNQSLANKLARAAD